MRLRTRALLALALIGLGLIIGAQITPGGTSITTRIAQSPADYIPDIYFLIPTAVSISISALNGTAYLTVTQIPQDLSNVAPVINVSVAHKDIVTFTAPARGYYSVAFLASGGIPVAVTYTLSQEGQPPDQTLAGSVLLIAGSVVLVVSVMAGRRKRKPPS